MTLSYAIYRVSDEYFASITTELLNGIYQDLAEHPSYKDNLEHLNSIWCVFSHHVQLLCTGCIHVQGPIPSPLSPLPGSTNRSLPTSTDFCMVM